VQTFAKRRWTIVFNRIILIGRLTRDPELRYTPTGNAVASFVLAVDRSFRRANGEHDTDFIPVVAWRGLGETVSQYVEKGRLVAVEGRLQVRTYERKDGGSGRTAEVVASAVRFLPDGKSRANLEEDLVAAPGEDQVNEGPPSD
jgi:single-strand DNA-binding protein